MLLGIGAAVIQGDSMTVVTVIIEPYPSGVMVGHGCQIRSTGL